MAEGSGSALRRVGRTAYRVIAEAASGLAEAGERPTLQAARSVARDSRRSGAAGTEVWAVRHVVEAELAPGRGAAVPSVRPLPAGDVGWLDNCSLSGEWQPTYRVDVPTAAGRLAVGVHGVERAYQVAAGIAASGRVNAGAGPVAVTDTVSVVRMDARFIERVMRNGADRQLG